MCVCHGRQHPAAGSKFLGGGGELGVYNVVGGGVMGIIRSMRGLKKGSCINIIRRGIFFVKFFFFLKGAHGWKKEGWEE